MKAIESVGILSDEVIQLDHIIRFKKIFGNEVSLMKVRAKFKYGLNSCGLCAKDLLLQNVPFYVNLAAKSTKTEIKQFLTEAFKGKLKNSAIIRHGRATPCVKSLQCDVNAVGIPVPLDSEIHHSIFWKLSPARRTVTINALALGYDNKIFNYFNTHDDLLQTIGETDGRIKADYSRILRYFRIYGRVANENCAPDKRTINIIKANMSGLEKIKGEQIWSEMKTILREYMRGEVVKMFFECGGFKYIGLPEDVNFDEFDNLLRKPDNDKNPYLAITYFCAFLNSSEEVLKLHQRLRFTAYERDLALFLVQHRAATRNVDDLVYYQRMCLQPIRGSKNVTKEFVLELLNYHHKPDLITELFFYCIMRNNIRSIN